MISQITRIRIRYCETDKMGFVHHSNYPRFLEEGRMELFRKIGLNYNEIEESGVILPVVSMNFKFKIPIFFDEIISVKTQLIEPINIKLLFHYEIMNQFDKIACLAQTTLTFADTKTRRPIRPPQAYIQKLTEVSKST